MITRQKIRNTQSLHPFRTRSSPYATPFPAKTTSPPSTKFAFTVNTPSLPFAIPTSFSFAALGLPPNAFSSPTKYASSPATCGAAMLVPLSLT